MMHFLSLTDLCWFLIFNGCEMDLIFWASALLYIFFKWHSASWYTWLWLWSVWCVRAYVNKLQYLSLPWAQGRGIQHVTKSKGMRSVNAKMSHYCISQVTLSRQLQYVAFYYANLAYAVVRRFESEEDWTKWTFAVSSSNPPNKWLKPKLLNQWRWGNEPANK